MTRGPLFEDGERILVVDDDPGVRRVLHRLLTSAGLRRDAYAEATSAEEALQMLGEARFHLVLTDFRMAGATGVDLLAWLRQNAPFTSRVLMTGYHDGSIAIDAVNQGKVQAFLQKPWDNAVVLETLQRVLRQARERRKAEAEGAARIARAFHDLTLPLRASTRETTKSHQGPTR